MASGWRFPVAYMLTTTTHGTWLHGDERGSVDRHGTSVANKLLGPNPDLEAHRRKFMKGEAFLLDANARTVVDQAIREYCAYKNWPLLALNVRTNHFHVVVPAITDGGKMLGAMKARATRLLRETKLAPPSRRIWTSRGGVTHLLDEDDIKRAVIYVLDGQGPDLPKP